MTIDILTATFFWPEGTLLHVRQDTAAEVENQGLRATEQAADPLMAPQGETFWATVLRQIGWPLPPGSVSRS